MTNHEYRAALEELGLTQRAASVLIGVSLRTSGNYATGATPIPQPVAKLVAAALDLKRNGGPMPTKPRIKTTHVRPSGINTRNFDWVEWHDGEEEQKGAHASSESPRATL
jgi:hypothetical protein